MQIFHLSVSSFYLFLIGRLLNTIFLKLKLIARIILNIVLFLKVDLWQDVMCFYEELIDGRSFGIQLILAVSFIVDHL